MDRPERLDDWFYMVMKEMRRCSYIDLLDSWEMTWDEAKEVHMYIEEKLGVKL